MNNWNTIPFSEFVVINPSVPLKNGEYYPFIEMKDLNENYRYVYPSNNRKLTGGSHFCNGDTLFARITPCLENGKICQAVGLERSKGFGSTEFLVFRNKPNISDIDFIYYLCRTDVVRRFAELHMVGTSGRQRVAKEAFENLVLELPPLPLQKRIAEILGALDDKIEINRQMNRTLEQMAQVLYKHYFVDEIDPENLPDGWKSGEFKEIVKIFTGKGLKREFISDSGEYPVYGANGIMGYSSHFLCDDSLILTGRVGTLGTTQLVNGKFWISDNVLAISPKEKSYYYYSYFTLKTFDFEAFNRGSTQPLITQTDLNDQNIIIPVLEFAERFQNHSNMLFIKIFQNINEVKTLTLIRDTLLPKLISGEIIPSDLQTIEKAL